MTRVAAAAQVVPMAMAVQAVLEMPRQLLEAAAAVPAAAVPAPAVMLALPVEAQPAAMAATIRLAVVRGLDRAVLEPPALLAVEEEAAVRLAPVALLEQGVRALRTYREEEGAELVLTVMAGPVVTTAEGEEEQVGSEAVSQEAFQPLVFCRYSLMLAYLLSFRSFRFFLEGGFVAGAPGQGVLFIKVTPNGFLPFIPILP
jgi:hypothetical protein